MYVIRGQRPYSVGIWKVSARQKKIAIDLCLIPFVAWVVIWPAATLIEGIIHIFVAGAVFFRCYLAWRDWYYGPQKMNEIWYDQGREAATETLAKIARLYELEEEPSPPEYKGQLGTSLYHARQDLIVRCGARPDLTAADMIAQAVHSFWVPVDRSQTLPSPGLKMRIQDPIPELNGFSADFSDICRDRAASILRENKEVAVFWSGGIDSTTALRALLEVAAPAEPMIISILYLDFWGRRKAKV